MNAVSGRRRLTPVVLTIALGFSAVALAAGLGLRINVTPSAPIGLWLVRPARLAQLQRDDYVLVCPPRVSWIARGFKSGSEHGLIKGHGPIQIVNVDVEPSDCVYFVHLILLCDIAFQGVEKFGQAAVPCV